MRSGYSCPTPTYMTGVEVTFTMDSAAPPRASASLLVRIEPSNFVWLKNSRAWLTVSFPASESPTKIFMSGFTTLVIFAICSIRFLFVCIRPAVSINTQSVLWDLAYNTASLATAAGSEL